MTTTRYTQNTLAIIMNGLLAANMQIGLLATNMQIFTDVPSEGALAPALG